MPIAVNKKANERSTYALVLTFTDEAGAELVPISLSWTLTDSAGVLINSRDSVAVASPTSEVTIVLSGADLPIGGGLTLTRVLTVEATYSSDLGVGLPFKEQVSFGISDLVAVPDPITP